MKTSVDRSRTLGALQSTRKLHGNRSRPPREPHTHYTVDRKNSDYQITLYGTLYANTNKRHIKYNFKNLYLAIQLTFEM